MKQLSLFSSLTSASWFSHNAILLCHGFKNRQTDRVKRMSSVSSNICIISKPVYHIWRHMLFKYYITSPFKHFIWRAAQNKNPSSYWSVHFKLHHEQLSTRWCTFYATQHKWKCLLFQKSSPFCFSLFFLSALQLAHSIKEIINNGVFLRGFVTEGQVSFWAVRFFLLFFFSPADWELFIGITSKTTPFVQPST